MVRLTKRFGYLPIKVIADTSFENSAYASSTISNPLIVAAAFANSSISEMVIAVPVGLFGVVTKVSAGLISFT